MARSPNGPTTGFEANAGARYGSVKTTRVSEAVIAAYCFPVFPKLRHRHCVALPLKLPGPQFLSGFRVEGAKAVIRGGADENQSARGDDRTRTARSAGIALAFREERIRAQRRLPCDVAGICIDRDDAAPWRRRQQERGQQRERRSHHRPAPPQLLEGVQQQRNLVCEFGETVRCWFRPTSGTGYNTRSAASICRCAHQ